MPLIAIFGFGIISKIGSTSNKIKKVFSYTLFFSVPVLTLTGFLGVLNGVPSSTEFPLLFGFSFYTASIAFQLFNGDQKLSINNALVSANPILAISGPINTRSQIVSHHSLVWRMNYFFPYFLVGLFFMVAVGSGLSPLLAINNQHNLIAFLIFGVIFELYIYFNFAGLTIMVYGLFGILGIRIPLNFSQPFSSTNLIEFWKGWHLSLSSVLKSLFYSPIRRKIGLFSAVMATFLASALWHGITINFIIWGILHGSMFYVTYLLLKHNLFYLPFILLPVVLILARGIFGTPNFQDLLISISTLPSRGDIAAVWGAIDNAKIETQFGFITAIIIVVLEFVLKKSKYGIGRNYKFLRTTRAQFVILIFTLVVATTSLGEIIAAYAQR